jgi:Fe-S cluster biogenesis protein NfuA
VAEESPFPSDELIREFLHTHVRPVLGVDRGGVELLRSDAADRRIVLRYTGACAGCPGLSVTHATIVGPLLRREYPAVRSVEAVIDGEREPAGEAAKSTPPA